MSYYISEKVRAIYKLRRLRTTTPTSDRIEYSSQCATKSLKVHRGPSIHEIDRLEPLMNLKLDCFCTSSIDLVVHPSSIASGSLYFILHFAFIHDIIVNECLC